MASSDSISSGDKSPSRGSFSRSAACRRPKLMRSSATAPSLATSNASRNDLAYLHSTTRATALLNRVASYSTSRSDHASSIGTPPDNRRRSVSPREHEMVHSLLDTEEEQKKNIYTAQGLYFSFPSFEEFHEDRDDGEKLGN